MKHLEKKYGKRKLKNGVFYIVQNLEVEVMVDTVNQ